MTQAIEKERYMVIFDDSDFERYFDHSWEAVKYAAMNEGLVLDRATYKKIADYRQAQYEYTLRG